MNLLWIEYLSIEPLTCIEKHLACQTLVRDSMVCSATVLTFHNILIDLCSAEDDGLTQTNPN